MGRSEPPAPYVLPRCAFLEHKTLLEHGTSIRRRAIRPRVAADYRYQTDLFGGQGSPVSFDETFAGLRRVHLDGSAWIDAVPSWLASSDALFDQLLSKKWVQRVRRIYDRDVIEPRLTARWTLGSGEPLEPPILDRMRKALSRRYGVCFDSVGFNLYRNGYDSVAWHRDRIRNDILEPIVPLVSLGERRKLMFRPRGGGVSRSFPVGHGDLLVTGGATQRAWEHGIPKVAAAGARMSLAFRCGAEPPDDANDPGARDVEVTGKD